MAEPTLGSKRSISKHTKLHTEEFPSNKYFTDRKMKFLLQVQREKEMKRLEMIEARRSRARPLVSSMTERKKDAIMPWTSYLIMEKRKLHKPTNSKISWSNLQTMKINELKGFFKTSFDPTDLLVNDQGTEDKDFLKEYQLHESANFDNKSNRVPSEMASSRKRELSTYGE